MTSSLRWPLAKSTHGTCWSRAKRRIAAAERVGDLPQRRGRGDRQPELALDVAEQPTGVLQLRHVHVAVHPVDALDLEHHMIGQDIGDTAR